MPDSNHLDQRSVARFAHCDCRACTGALAPAPVGETKDLGGPAWLFCVALIGFALAISFFASGCEAADFLTAAQLSAAAAFVRVHWPAIAGGAVAVSSAIVSGSQYPQRLRGAAAWTLRILDLISVARFYDSPGSLKVPLSPSPPPLPSAHDALETVAKAIGYFATHPSAPPSSPSSATAPPSSPSSTTAPPSSPSSAAAPPSSPSSTTAPPSSPSSAGGGTVAALLLGVALLAGVGACHASPTVVAATATAATVQSLDEAIDVFAQQEIAAEASIANGAIAACKSSATAAAYSSCAAAYVAPKRAPDDRARAAIKTYQQLLAAGASTDVSAAAGDVLGALAALGIHVAPSSSSSEVK